VDGNVFETEDERRESTKGMSLEFRNQVIFIIWAEAAGYSDNPLPPGQTAPYEMKKMDR
jgi:hypothetical protein